MRFADSFAAVNKSKTFGKIIIPHGVIPEMPEMEVANLFTGLGKDIEFIKPHFIKGLRNPDIKMDGRIWEIKSPHGRNKGTIENLYKTVEKQSENIIFDLRHIGLDEKIAISKIKREFSMRRNKVKRIKIITKNAEVLDISR
jgi:hypothetical protein